MKNFYKSKYSQPPGETDVSPAQVAALKDKHAVAVCPIATEEVSEALARTRPNTSSGNDAVCYMAIKTFFSNDLEGKLVGFFNQILNGTLSVPAAWTRGKLCFLPKCPRPARPQDLRPISLTPCVGKVFARILITFVF